MRAKEFLRQAKNLDESIKTKLKYLDYLNDLATKCTSTISKTPGGNGTPNSLDETVAKIIDLQNEINAEIDQLVNLKIDIAKVISQIADPTERLILEKRYLCCMLWEDICFELNYSKRGVLIVHGRALDNVDKILNAGAKN